MAANNSKSFSAFQVPTNPSNAFFTTTAGTGAVGIQSSNFRNKLANVNYDQGYKYTFYSDETKILQSDYLEKISDPATNASFSSLIQQGIFWLDVLHPNNFDMNYLSKIFNIHPLTIEDIQDTDPREKYEVYENYLFFVVRTCDQNMSSPTFLEPFNLFIIMFSDFIVTIHDQPIEHIRGVFRVIDRLNTSLSSDWVMYALLDHIVDGFMINRKPLELEVDAIDDLVLILTENDQPDMLRRIGIARKRVTQMFRYMHPKIDIVKWLVKRNESKLSQNTILYLRDTQDHLLTMTQNLEHLGETLNRSHSNYLAQISIEITQASNRTNEVVQKLSVWAAIFVPLTLLSGIWGMNVPVLFGKDVPWYELGPFFGIVLFMCLLGAMIFFLAKRYKLYN